MNQKIERILANVQKPGRYVGGELNAVIKDKAGCRCTVCILFSGRL